MKIFIAEDEPLAAAKLKLFLEKAGVGDDITHFSDGRKLLDALTSTEAMLWPDVIFLDIQMPNFTGLQFLEALKASGLDAGRQPDVIITSAYDQYAIDGFNYGVTDYLLKPYTQERLKQSLGKLRNRPSAHEALVPSISLRCEGRNEIVPLEQIVCVEAVKDYTTFILADLRRITTLGSLGQFEQQLPAAHFQRIQRSYIVNLRHVQSYSAQTVRLTAGIEVPLGKTYRETFEKSLKNDLS